MNKALHDLSQCDVSVTPVKKLGVALALLLCAQGAASGDHAGSALTGRREAG